jgi:ATP-dependent protease ClpP protease subunit
MRLPRLLAAFALSLVTLCSLCGCPPPRTGAVATAASNPSDETEQALFSVRFDADIEEGSRQRFELLLQQAQQSHAQAILFVFNTRGGDTDAGQRIARDMEDAPVPVFCLVDGKAASMGFYILQSCKLRFMLKRSMLMAHEPSNSLPMNGNRFEHEEYINWLKTLALSMAEHEVARMKISRKEFLARTDRRDWVMGWEDALKYGAVDEVFDSVDAARESLQKRMHLQP